MHQVGTMPLAWNAFEDITVEEMAELMRKPIPWEKAAPIYHYSDAGVTVTKPVPKAPAQFWDLFEWGEFQGKKTM